MFGLGLLVPAIKFLALLLAVQLVRKKNWPYPLAALLFVLLPLMVMPLLDPFARWIVTGEAIDFGLVLASLMTLPWPMVIGAVLSFIGAWVFLWLLEKYDETYAETAIYGVGAAILVLLL